MKFGVRNVPVVARGSNYVFGQNLEDVAEFVGLQGTGHKPLPPEVLIERWITVLETAQSYIRLMPDEKLKERVIPNRDRSLKLMTHHIFRIPEAFLEAAAGGEYTVPLANIPPPDDKFNRSAEIADYGKSIIERLNGWWGAQTDKSCQQKVKTFFGHQPLAMLFERSTWHSAQHTRQLANVLKERFGIEPQPALRAETLAGLPLPERLWE